MIERTLPPLQNQQPTEALTQSQLDALVSLHERFLQGRIGGRRATLKRMDISGLSLAHKDLRQADFSGCNMRYMDLSFTSFQEATLYACDLSFSNLIHTNFLRADLRGSRIESANLSGADLEQADLRGGAMTHDGSYAQPQPVNFRGANLTGAKLIGSMANNADFSDANMAMVKIVGADLRGARMVGTDLSGADFNGTKLNGAVMDHAILTGVNIDMLAHLGIDLSTAITDKNVGPSVMTLELPLNQLIEYHILWVKSAGREGRSLDLSGYDIREVVSLKKQKLTAVKAKNAKFFGMNLFQVEMQSADVEGADFRRCDMVEVDFRGANVKGAKFSHADLRRANFMPLIFNAGGVQRFAPCDASGAELRYADLSDGQFKGANFAGADLSFANLTGCDVRDANFTGANLMNVVWDNAQTDGAQFDDKPKGSTFSLSSLEESE